MTNAIREFVSERSRIIARVMVFWGGYLAILWVASFVKAKFPQPWGALAWGLTSSAAIVSMTLLLLRRESRNARDIGLNINRATLLRLLFGLLVGFAVYGLQIVVVDLIVGPIHFAWQGGATAVAVTSGVLGTLALACMEELGFRGYPLRTLVLGLGLWPAQAIVAVAFGLCHFAFGWSWTTILLGVIPGGLLFGMAAVSSRGLAMPIGLHAGLNLAQSSLSGKSSWGFCKLVMDDEVRDRVARIAPFSGVAVVALVTLAFWWWWKLDGEFKENSHAETCAAPNGGPAAPVDNSNAPGAPPSVS